MKYKFILSVMALFLSLSVSAQEENYPHAFVGLQGGVMRPYNGVHIDRDLTPAGAVSLGYFFTDVFGLRLQGNGSFWDAKLPDGSKYGSKAASIDLDMLFNLSNVFFPNRNNFVNVIAVAGAPFNIAVPHTWVMNYAQATTKGTDKWNTAWRAGGQIEFNVAKNWGINLEAGANYVRQPNSTIIDNNRWWPYAMAGLTYKFGFKKDKKVTPAPVAEKVVEEPKPEPKQEPKPVVKPEPKPEPKPVVKQLAKTTENVFFKLGKANIEDAQAEKVEKLAKWAVDHPTAVFDLTGYADKDTGTAKLNMALSEKRAAAVKDALVKKGVQANRISVNWKGDTIQPFNMNDDNRVVVVLGEEK